MTAETEPRMNLGSRISPLELSPEDSAQRERFIREFYQGDKAHPETQEQA